MIRMEELRRAIEIMAKSDDGTGLAKVESVDVYNTTNATDVEIRMWLRERDPDPGEEYGPAVDNWMREEVIIVSMRHILNARNDRARLLGDIALEMRKKRALSSYSKLCLRIEQLPLLVHKRKYSDAAELAKDVWVELEQICREGGRL